MYTLLLLTALTQPAPAAPDPADRGANPPEQGIASIDAKGKMTIIHISSACLMPANREHTVTAKGEKATVKLSSVVVTTVANVSLALVSAFSDSFWSRSPTSSANFFCFSPTASRAFLASSRSAMACLRGALAARRLTQFDLSGPVMAIDGRPLPSSRFEAPE